jgi:hypothetical protein
MPHETIDAPDLERVASAAAPDACQLERIDRADRAGHEPHAGELNERMQNRTWTCCAIEIAADRLRGRVRVTRPASGLPVGGVLEYADEVTLGRALTGRRDVPRSREAWAAVSP